MAAPAVHLQSYSRVAFWECFRAEVRRRVIEANEAAGEPLWNLEEGDYPLPWLGVGAGAPRDCRVLCSFDLDDGVVIGATAWPWSPHRSRVVVGGREYDVASLATRFLDELPYEDVYENSRIERHSRPLDQERAE